MNQRDRLQLRCVGVNLEPEVEGVFPGVDLGAAERVAVHVGEQEAARPHGEGMCGLQPATLDDEGGAVEARSGRGRLRWPPGMPGMPGPPFQM